jgi:hypothetical protein
LQFSSVPWLLGRQRSYFDDDFSALVSTRAGEHSGNRLFGVTIDEERIGGASFR